MNNEAFEELINKYCDGSISKEESTVLEEALLNSSQLRQQYYSFMTIDAGLRELSESTLDLELDSKLTHKRKLHPSLWGLIPIIAIVASFFLFQNDSAPQNTINLGTYINVENPKDSTALNQNSTVELSEGTYEIELESGTKLLIEGPCEFKLTDPVTMKLKQGNALVSVPNNSQGLFIQTSNYTISSFGSSYSLSIEKNDVGKVYVTQGTINFRNDAKTLKTLNSQEGISWQEKNISSIDSLRLERLLEARRQNQIIKLKKWEKYTNSFKGDDSLLLYYDFEDIKNSTVLNKSRHQWGALNGIATNCESSTSRWPNKTAMSFNTIGSRVRLDVPGKYENITFSCWLKINRFDRWLSSLFLTDHFNENEVHWQISDIGEMILGSQTNGNTFSPSVISKRDIHRWIHLVSVYDSEKLQIRHYIDGKEVHNRSIHKAYPVRLGKSEIGNWVSNPNIGHSIRSLNGSIDDFMIFSRAFSSTEVKEMFSIGSSN
ncbi:MAG: FecR domain-containing protein [Lentisphaeraceae bacterium]|nr:FecR domain-containing protein [Lentisphaeraceae bacterium]